MLRFTNHCNHTTRLCCNSSIAEITNNIKNNKIFCKCFCYLFNTIDRRIHQLPHLQRWRQCPTLYTRNQLLNIVWPEWGEHEWTEHVFPFNGYVYSRYISPFPKRACIDTIPNKTTLIARWNTIWTSLSIWHSTFIQKTRSSQLPSCIR